MGSCTCTVASQRITDSRKESMMMSYYRRHTLTFTATDPEGNEITVHGFTRLTHADTLIEPPEDMELGKEYRTQDGRRVNRQAKGRYEIVGIPSIPLSSDDPNAP
jgi:hypothetical protein